MSSNTVRYLAIIAVLMAASLWSFGAAVGQEEQYPGDRYLATGEWLRAHIGDPDLVVVDVRSDDHFDGRVIPGAVRMPWSLFRADDPARGVGGLFVGTVQAQKNLGDHGISRIHEVVLYDSVQRDGGATSSYLFWVLDHLGHARMRVLERGIDGWIDAGGELAARPREPEPVLYQAPADEIRPQRSVQAPFVYSRLGDPYYLILDVRSRGEYLGETINKALDGGALKAGHIPTAVNLEYKLNWADSGTKAIKPYTELRALYAGIDPGVTVITYCHSARRGSFGYYILRLMGYEKVTLYDPSWFEWGNPENFYPVETRERILSGTGSSSPVGAAVTEAAQEGEAPRSRDGSGSNGGYISCGG